MKLIVKSDDYGFTKGVTDGTFEAMKNGIITCTGLFSNMPSAVYAVEKIKECPHVCFGIDINVVSGPCVSDPKDIPTLVDENGEFILSTVKKADTRFIKGGDNEELWPFNECYIEAKAQVEKFIEIVGKKPEYLTGHSISPVAGNYSKAIKKVAAEYKLPFAKDLFADFNVKRLPSLNKKPFPIEQQAIADAEENALKQLELYKDEEYVLLSGHGGYVDNDLLKYSTFTLIRAKDVEMYTSKRIKKWLEENGVELISFRDLLRNESISA